MKNSADYRNVARGNLKNNWGTAVLVCIIIAGISTILSFIPYIGSVVSLLLCGQLAVGEIMYFIKLHNKQDARVGSIFEGFGENWINNLLTYLLQTIYIILWSLLLIIPGIIKSYAYSMTMYLKAKQPNLTSNEAISKSQQIMDGKKWKLFCLQLSFIGWAILSIFTFGIGFLFLMPYMQSSTIAFYEDAYNAYQQVKEPDLSADDEIVIEDNN